MPSLAIGFLKWDSLCQVQSISLSLGLIDLLLLENRAYTDKIDVPDGKNSEPVGEQVLLALGISTL